MSKMPFYSPAFLDTLVLQLRNLRVDMSPRGAAPNTIERTNNPTPCYKIVCWGHTPDDLEHGDQPAYRFEAFAFPETRQLFINSNEGNGDWWRILFPSCGGYTPAEYALRQHGLVDYNQDEWTIITE